MKLPPTTILRAALVLLLALALGACATSAPHPAVSGEGRRAAVASDAAGQRHVEQKPPLATAEGRRGQPEPPVATANTADRDAQMASLQAEAARSTARAEAQGQAGGQAPAPAQAQTLAQAQTPVQTEDAQRQAILARQNAEYARQQARGDRPRSEWFDAELRELHATKSDRGIVVTINDVLFAPGKADLRPGGVRLVGRIATLLREYPDRTIAIEGFTDSVGDDALNRVSSEQRADAVRAALVGEGIADNRIVTRGYGEAFPVAGNDTAEGRQRNRRVDVVIGAGTEVAPRVASNRPTVSPSRP